MAQQVTIDQNLLEGIAASAIVLDLHGTNELFSEMFPGVSYSDIVHGVEALRERHEIALTVVPAPTMRVEALRRELQTRKLDGFLIPLTNEHQGEFIDKRSKRLGWLTGFGGSAGIAVVLKEDAAIFVDGRYTLQVLEQVNTEIFEPCQLKENLVGKWISSNAPKRTKIGYDWWLHTLSDMENLQSMCIGSEIEFVPLDENPIDKVWKDQPPRPLGPVVLQRENYAGKDSIAKREAVVESMIEAGEEFLVLTAPESIAWLLNIRGFDVPNTPLALSYVILDKTGGLEWFIDHRKLTVSTKNALDKTVIVGEPGSFIPALAKLGSEKKIVRLDPSTSSEAIYSTLTDCGAKIVEGMDFCTLSRAKKNSAELKGARAAHIRDGAVLTSFLAWISRVAPTGNITEINAANMLYELRKKDPKFRGLSFDTISGSGPHGAIVHYRATPETDRALSVGDLYLVDSGAQYLDGTTDVTRTIYIVKPGGGCAPPKVQEHFTRVLKGHIAIARTKFPEGTHGGQIDALARIALWEVGLDYDHGTGHGVGSYLGVHEGPQRISKKGSQVPMEAGMILSNEPGYYQKGEYGIRIENLIAVTELTDEDAGNNGQMLAFETLTLAPIDKNLIVTELLTTLEKKWLNDYHLRVREILSPLIDDETRDWLHKSTVAV